MMDPFEELEWMENELLGDMDVDMRRRRFGERQPKKLKESAENRPGSTTEPVAGSTAAAEGTTEATAGSTAVAEKGGAGTDVATTSGGDSTVARRDQGRLRLHRVPRFEVNETEDAVTLRGETPGIPKENLKININNGILNISGENKEEKEEPNMWMRRFGSFSHSWLLPQRVDPDSVDAKYNDGVLSVRFNKRAVPEAQRKEITIQ